MRRGLAALALVLASPCPAQRAAPATSSAAASPADLYGPLFAAVQMRRLFPDGKTFADAVPRRAPAAILADYRRGDRRGDWRDDAKLRAFVLANFALPADAATPASATGPRLPLARHIAELWPRLTRPALAPPPGASALALPRAYVVPGGRFRELYYWDSYFTMMGLVADGRRDLLESTLDDFVSLVERYGHVPNGARTYYLSRSQPPFLYLMADLSDRRDPAVQARRLRALIREHAFWIAERSVTMPDGSVLQRYGDARRTPRDESYREDVETARDAPDKPRLWNDLRAGAESGWDYSSRWLADGRTLATIETGNVVPVDLNALLWGLERAIARRAGAAGDAAAARRFAAAADARARSVERWLWSDAEGRYGDWDLARRRVRSGITAAAAYPAFVGLGAPGRWRRNADAMGTALMAPGGLRTTNVATGQQWDRPNGWAPLQWVGIVSLTRAGRPDLARAVATRFLATAEREYRRSGKLLEKYDVEESRPGGGGEYPTQDGFGWTNGVLRAIQVHYGPGGTSPPEPSVGPQ